jgi:hypothetical protein
MKRKIQIILILLTICAVILLIFSTYGKQSQILDILKTDNHTTKGLSPAVIEQCPAVRDSVPEIDTTSQRILLIGDSMASGLRFRFQEYCNQNNHTLLTVTWISSSTKWFATYDTLDYFIDSIKPTFIILVIGSNELFIKDIKANRDKYVKTIIDKIGDIKYIWVGPPNWKNDTGINDLIKENVHEKRFFPSKNLYFNRIDVAHPTRRSSDAWVDSIAFWIVKKSFYPIKLERPKKRILEDPERILLKPLP